MTEAVIKATYVTYKPVPTRKVLQLVFEVPLESAPAAHQTLGQPMPDTETWVAIARLQRMTEAELEEGLKPLLPDKPKRNWSQLSRAEQAGIACQDPDFARFLENNYSADHKHNSADTVRRICGVHSRSELDTKPMIGDRWDRLYSDYQLWKRGAAA